jgi:DNA adenine methylase
MKFMGSKYKHAKNIIQLLNHTNATYVEPFCGGCNVIDKITGPRIASDIDPDLISLYQAVAQGWLPPKIFTEEQYHQIKTEPPSPLKGYAAFALSYGGKKFGGWRRDKLGKRNYVLEAYNNAIKQFPKLIGVNFQLCHYANLIFPNNSTVYCDPPYQNTTPYSIKFDHTAFWNWIRIISKNNRVLVSEYNAPPDFICIWQKSVPSSLTANTGSKRNIEKLWILT